MKYLFIGATVTEDFNHNIRFKTVEVINSFDSFEDACKYSSLWIDVHDYVDIIGKYDNMYVCNTTDFYNHDINLFYPVW